VQRKVFHLFLEENPPPFSAEECLPYLFYLQFRDPEAGGSLPYVFGVVSV